jgi:Tfp pilus assembly protein PilO
MPVSGGFPMNKISKEKRKQLFLALIVIIVVFVAIYMGLIQPQYQTLRQIESNRQTVESQIKNMKATIAGHGKLTNDLAQTSIDLASCETNLASGDLYAWTYDTVRKLKQGHQVEIANFGQPSLEAVDILPSFPYKQIRFGLNGTAFFHDLGKFIADIENTYPQMRVVRLSVEPSPESDSNIEKLSFHMDVIVLVKSNPS